VEAKSPTDRILNCPVIDDNGVYTATFQPDEAGEWKISVTYEDEHIQGSPFTCFVFDPHAVKVKFLFLFVNGFSFSSHVVGFFSMKIIFPRSLDFWGIFFPNRNYQVEPHADRSAKYRLGACHRL
jgi:Filamin/ABP280 repeat